MMEMGSETPALEDRAVLESSCCAKHTLFKGFPMNEKHSVQLKQQDSMTMPRPGTKRSA